VYDKKAYMATNPNFHTPLALRTCKGIGLLSERTVLHIDLLL